MAGRLRKLRDSYIPLGATKSLSIPQFANEIVGVPESQYQKWESRGAVSGWGVSKIVAGTGVSADDLVGLHAKPAPVSRVDEFDDTGDWLAQSWNSIDAYTQKIIFDILNTALSGDLERRSREDGRKNERRKRCPIPPKLGG